MIPKNLPPAIPPIERARESLAATVTAANGIAPTPNLICNAPISALPAVNFKLENSAQLHMRELKSAIDQRMHSMDVREAKVRDHIQEQRGNASVFCGPAERGAWRNAEQSGKDHQAAKVVDISRELPFEAHSAAISISNEATIKMNILDVINTRDRTFVKDL